MTIQAILFNKKNWTLDKVNNYLKEKNIIPIKAIHETENFYRARLEKPNFRQYYTRKSKNGIEYIIAY